MMTGKKSKIAIDDHRRKREQTAPSLSEQDRLLWQHVAASVRPLASKKRQGTISGQNDPATEESFLSALISATAIVSPSSQSLRQSPQKTSPSSKNVQNIKNDLPTRGIIQGLHRKAQRKIARQHFDHAARLDLHGLDQNSAYTLLLHFIHTNVRNGQSLILVITGKGRTSGGEGILRQLVPQWLATPPFRSHVSAVESASRHHGGEGAFYVKLRKTSSR